MIDIVVNALVAGLLLAAVCGPLGALVTWQRMAYFGDTLAHSALLGLAAGLALQVNLDLAVLGSSLLLAALLFALQWRQPGGSLDSLLGILSHSSLALGLVVLSFFSRAQFDLNSFLFGDLLAVMRADLALLASVTIGILLLLWRFWDALVAITAHGELAAVEGRRVAALRLLMMLTIAATVAIAMKIVGVLLITAMLIIPASAAGRLARSPEQCALFAVAIGGTAVSGGLAAAWQWDSPAGPSIVLGAALLYGMSLIVRPRSQN